MTDKTSWTKPPFRHRYGDSRLAVWGAEGVLGSPPPPPPEGGEEPRRPTGAERPGAAASGRAPPGAEQRGSAGSWSGIGRTGVPVRNMRGEHLHEPGEGSRAGRRDAQRPVASLNSPAGYPPKPTEPRLGNLVGYLGRCVVFVGQRRAEEGDAVAHHPVHGTLVVMDGVHHAFQDGIENLARFFGIPVGERVAPSSP